MRRHRALAVIAASLILFASQTWGQQPVHRVVLANMKLPETTKLWLEGLGEHGYVVGQNLQVEYRYWQARTERIPALVAELVAFGPDVIVTATTQSVVAVHAAAPTIPLVFLNMGSIRKCGCPGREVIWPDDATGREAHVAGLGRRCDRSDQGVAARRPAVASGGGGRGARPRPRISPDSGQFGIGHTPGAVADRETDVG